MAKIYLCVDRDGWTGGYQLSIDDDTGTGFRIAGPKYNGSSKRVIRHQITTRDAGRIREYLEKITPAVAETRRTASDDFGLVSGVALSPTNSEWNAAVEKAEPIAWAEKYLEEESEVPCTQFYWDKPEVEVGTLEIVPLYSKPQSLGDVFNDLVRRMNFDGMDPRTFTLGELQRAIDGAEFMK